MVTRNITVVHLESDCVSFLSANRKPRKIALEYLLRAYAREMTDHIAHRKKEGKKLNKLKHTLSRMNGSERCCPMCCRRADYVG